MKSTNARCYRTSTAFAGSLECELNPYNIAVQAARCALSLAAQGGQRLPSYFNIQRGNPTGLFPF
jgi:hypothetical protein